MTEEQNQTEINTEESWEEAKKIAGLIGEVPSLFSTALHFLRVDAKQNSNTLGDNTVSTLKTLLKSDSFTAAIHNASLAYRPHDSADRKFKTRLELADIFSASELQYIVSMLYLYRRIRKGCDPEIFQPHSASLIEQVELAGLIGTAIPAIGLPTALLVTGFPMLGMGMFIGIDKKGFQKQKTRLKISNEPFNLELEHQRWGCNHLQITALLLQSLSAGAKVFDAVVLGLSAKTLDEAEAYGIEDVYKSKLTQVWLESLLSTGKAPTMTHRGEYYPLKDDLQVLEDAARKVKEKGAITGWLNSNMYDLDTTVFVDNEKDTTKKTDDDLEQLLESKK